MRSLSRYPRPARLFLESLEGREVPAGAITATLAHGKLTITGDDQANGLSLLVAPGSVTVTPDSSTAVNGQPANTAVTLTGTATSLSAKLGGGNDSLAIDAAADFVLTGAVAIDLGDGNNTLNLKTTGKIQLGSLAVTGGDGTDAATVGAGAGLGSVAGNASFNFGLGQSILTLAELKIHGPAGLKVAASKTSGSATLTATDVTVDKGVSVAGGSSGIGGGQATFNNSTIGSLTASGVISEVTLTGTTVNGKLSATGSFQDTADLTNATVNGAMTLKGSFESGLQFANTTTTGNVSVTGGVAGSADLTNTTVNGGVAVKGSIEAEMTVSNATITGDVNIQGGFETELDNDNNPGGNTFSARNVTVTSTTTATVDFSGSGSQATIAGNLTVAGKLGSSVTFTTPAPSEVAGNVNVKGGSVEGLFETNEFFKADKDVTLQLGNGANEVDIGDGNASVPILGNLKIMGGGGSDSVDLEDVAVSKNTTIALGAGADILSIDRGSSFAGTFSADMGAGDDFIAIAQATGASAPVTFTGKATITAGDGNDTLTLGLDPGSGGDANSKAVFNGTGNKIDGGAGFNTFDGLTPGQAPSQYTGLTAANFLNWTDPNP